MSHEYPCAACGDRIQDEIAYAIHRDGFCEGPEVPLCEACGKGQRPTCTELWAAIAERQVVDIGYSLLRDGEVAWMQLK